MLKIRITLPLNAYSLALTYTSATLGGAAMNCLPVSTFFLAILFRYFALRTFFIIFLMFLVSRFSIQVKTLPLDYHYHKQDGEGEVEDTTRDSKGGRASDLRGGCRNSCFLQRPTFETLFASSNLRDSWCCATPPPPIFQYKMGDRLLPLPRFGHGLVFVVCLTGKIS